VTGQQSNLSVKARLDRLHRWAAGVDQVVHSRREPADAKNTTSPGRRRQRCLSDDQVHSLVEAYEAGVAINELAAEFHVHRTTVLDHVNRAGTKRRYRALRSQQLEEAAQLRGAGKSFRDIGRCLGVHASTVRQHLTRASAVAQEGHKK